MHRSLLLLLLSGCASSHEPYALEGWEMTVEHFAYPTGSRAVAIHADGSFEGRRWHQLERCSGALTDDDVAAWRSAIDDFEVLERDGDLDERHVTHTGSTRLWVRSPDGREARVFGVFHPLVDAVHARLDAHLETHASTCTRLRPRPADASLLATAHVDSPSEAWVLQLGDGPARGHRDVWPQDFSGRVSFDTPCPGFDDPVLRAELLELAADSVPPAPRGPAVPRSSDGIRIHIGLEDAEATYYAPIASPLGHAIEDAVRRCPEI